jgi:hypothetical protein
LACDGDSIQTWYNDVLRFSQLCSVVSGQESVTNQGPLPGRKVRELNLSIGKRTSGRSQVDDVVRCFPGVSTISMIPPTLKEEFSPSRMHGILKGAVVIMKKLNTLRLNWHSLDPLQLRQPLVVLARFTTIKSLIIDFRTSVKFAPSGKHPLGLVTGGSFTSLTLQHFRYSLEEASWIIGATQYLETLDISFALGMDYRGFRDCLQPHCNSLKTLQLGCAISPQRSTRGFGEVDLSFFTFLEEASLAIDHYHYGFM